MGLLYVRAAVVTCSNLPKLLMVTVWDLDTAYLFWKVIGIHSCFRLILMWNGFQIVFSTYWIRDMVREWQYWNEGILIVLSQLSSYKPERLSSPKTNLFKRQSDVLFSPSPATTLYEYPLVKYNQHTQLSLTSTIVSKTVSSTLVLCAFVISYSFDRIDTKSALVTTVPFLSELLCRIIDCLVGIAARGEWTDGSVFWARIWIDRKGGNMVSIEGQARW